MGISSSKCTSTARLDGKTAIVTGANAGIGKETVKDYYIRGARVILACRNLEKANQAVEAIKKQCSGLEGLGQLCVAKLDLARLSSVRECAKSLSETEKNINLLINNAGCFTPKQHKTEDGFEMQFGINHLGHFLLTLLLLPKILQSAPARIINVSSVSHKYAEMDFSDLNWEKREYNGISAYAQTKLANILFTKELVRRLHENNISEVTVYSLHPGVIATELTRQFSDDYFTYLSRMREILAQFFLKTPTQGAQTTIHCAVEEKCAQESGLYYAECTKATESVNAQNVEDAKRLWKESLKLVKLDDNYDPFMPASHPEPS